MPRRTNPEHKVRKSSSGFGHEQAKRLEAQLRIDWQKKVAASEAKARGEEPAEEPEVRAEQTCSLPDCGRKGIPHPMHDASRGNWYCSKEHRILHASVKQLDEARQKALA